MTVCCAVQSCKTKEYITISKWKEKQNIFEIKWLPDSLMDYELLSRNLVLSRDFICVAGCRLLFLQAFLFHTWSIIVKAGVNDGAVGHYSVSCFLAMVWTLFSKACWTSQKVSDSAVLAYLQTEEHFSWLKSLGELSWWRSSVEVCLCIYCGLCHPTWNDFNSAGHARFILLRHILCVTQKEHPTAWAVAEFCAPGPSHVQSFLRQGWACWMVITSLT